jgi:hypothetical protein
MRLRQESGSPRTAGNGRLEKTNLAENPTAAAMHHHPTICLFYANMNGPVQTVLE